jgi:hypothetical protein
MRLTMMSSAEWDRELVAHFAAEGWRLGKTQMMHISRTATTDQARLLGNRFDMFAIANPTRLRQRQPALIDYRSSSLPGSTPATDAARKLCSKHA